MKTIKVQKRIDELRETKGVEQLFAYIQDEATGICRRTDKESCVHQWALNIFCYANALFDLTNKKMTPMEHLSFFLNTFSGVKKETFLEELRSQHRTLQQIFAGYVLAFINEYATNFAVDGRNKSSVEECRKLLKAYHTATGEEKIRDWFPMI